MHHSRRKSFNWYGLKQHFSIRKYHFGAASVLLGMSIALGTGTQVVQAAETVTTPESTSVASSTSATESTTSETSTETATSSSSERTVEIGYIVKYATEDDTLANASVETVSVTTTETIAKATVSVTAVVPEGYELASGQSATVSQEVTENGENIVTVKVVKKVEATETVSSPTTTSTTVATASSTTRAATSTTPTTPTTPTTVEEAKKVLEQVTSEAEVLANETNRLVAADSTNEALKTAATATKLVATKATVTFQNAFATLEEVNAQISAVRTSVEALVLELRKYYPDGNIVALMATATSTAAATTIETTNPASVSYAQHGVWEITDLAKAANSGLHVADQKATITEANKNIPAGYIGDQDANRDTFLIIELDEKAGDGKGFNEWVGKNYYITFSVSTDAAERAANDVVYAKLVEKTDSGSTVVNTIELKPGVENNFNQLKVLENNAAHKTIYGFTYKVSTAGGTTRNVAMKNSNGNNRNVIKYSKLEPSRVDAPFNSTSFLVTGSTTQTTSYFVKENAATGRERELLAKYTQTGGLSGDAFHIAGAIDFDNYELIESELPTVTSGTLTSDYVVGSQYISYGANFNEARLYTITDQDGSLQIQVYMLDPNNPDWAKFYKTNQNNATVSDIPEYFKLMFTTEVLAPQTYNSKQGTATLKFYEANKLVLESTEIQVLDANGDVLGTLSDDKSTITTTAGSTIAVASTTDTMVTGTDGTIYTVNYNKIYKTDAAGNYVDADGKVLTPILWDKATPNNPYVKNIYGPNESGVDNVTISTGPLAVNQHPDGVWYFGYNYETAASETRLTDSETDKRWDLGGQELTLRNANTKNEQHALYWYTEKGGVKVYYVDTEGNVLQDSKSIYDHANTNTAYDTKSVKDATITTADGTVYYYKEIDTADLHPASSNTDTEKRKIEKITEEVGTVAQDTLKELTYVYEKAGNVNVNYVDVDGNKLSGTDGTGKVVTEKVADLVNAKAGTGYDTIVDNRPAKIVTADGKTYELAPAAEYTVGTVEADHHLSVSNVTEVTGVHEATGSVASGITKEITFVYKEVTGKVIVHYVDQDGNPISGTTDEGKKTASTVTDTPESSTGTPYDTKDLKPKTITTDDGKIYKLVPAATQGNETGKVVVGTTEITYVYELVQGDVIVHYVDTEGNTIADDVTDQTITDTGTDYDTRDNKPEKITNDQTGEVYYILPKDEVKAGDKETGKVVEGTTEVTYVYEKAGNVVVNYVDTEGNVLKDPVADVTDGKPGSGYDTVLDNKLASISVDGKLYRLAPANTYNVGTVSGDNNLTAVGNGKATGIDATTGTVEAGKTKEITYVYQEVKGDVVVEYYDTEGNTIAKTEVDTPTTSVDTPYETYDHKPATITVVEKDGSETVYYYKEVKDTSAPEKGDVVEGTTTVQYVYEKAGNVNVNYVDTEGNVIQAPVADVTDGKPDSAYATTDHKPEEITTADGKTYRLVAKEKAGDYPVGTVSDEGNLTAVGNGTATGVDSETGTVEAGKTKEITYVYEEVKGDVIVHYVDTEGNPISGTTDEGKKTASTVTDTPESSTGTPYDTTDLKPKEITTDEGKTYRIVPTLTKGDETGDVVEGTTEITYVYEEVKGDVVVNYVNTAGEVIASQVVDTKTTSTGTAYDTTDHKPSKITTEDGTVYYYKEVKAGDKETGKVVEGTTEVTYVYEPGGSVTVNYVTTDGKVIKSPVKDEENAEPGKTYSTEDNKPTTITTEDGKTYKLVPKATKGEENGTVTSGEDKQVTYVYEEVKGNVVVEYYNTAGEKIAADVEDTPASSTGTAYTTLDHKPAKITATDGTVYYYKEVKADSAVETGNVVEGTTTVKYVYEQAGNVVVNYVTEDGIVIKSPVKDETDAPAGKSYDTTDNKPTEIVTEDGSRYVLIPSKTIGSENGKVEGGKTTEITYVYKKVANWIPEIPGVPENERPVIPYPFDPNNPDVPVTPTPGTVIPNVPGYTPVDPKDNTPLKPVDPNDPGKGYVPPTPEKTGEDTLIPYVQNGNVVVNYVTEDGTVIKSPVKDETDAPAGKSYDTTDNKPTEIVTEDGSRYVLIPSKTIGSENGTVEGGKTTEITYVYKKVANWIPEIPGVPENERPVIPYPFDPNNPDVPVTPTPGTVIPNVPGYTPVDPKDNTPLKPVDPNDPGKGYVPPTPEKPGEDTLIPYVQNGNVVVNYVTEDGTVIKSPVKDETDAPAGKSYDTTDNKPNTITTEDGTTYELVRVEGSETGTVVGGKTTEVTYVYRKVETPAKKVVTNHVDEDGNPIAPQEEGTTPNKSIPGYEFTGKTVTDPDGNTTHIYRKVTKVVTNHVDEDGNPIAPQEEGTTPNKSIPGYEFTGKTVTDPDGNTTHIYRKVSKPVAPKPQAPVAPTTAKAGAAQLPNTGEASSSATVLGAGMLIAALALAGKRRRNED
ncbi:MucBP domain-containing protein [Streptococcus suis]|uniref:MucBP domain-containing protein n=1 Tax=Streptococcus suis TaxID=1307 RepID=UPI0024127506|nr:MucBP domain-containing protein [Streptococcus suis]MDG4522179.1 MucBP domain-containing protein [Streptococcus suis]